MRTDMSYLIYSVHRPRCAALSALRLQPYISLKWLCFHLALICITYLDCVNVWFTWLHLHLILKYSYGTINFSCPHQNHRLHMPFPPIGLMMIEIDSSLFTTVTWRSTLDSSTACFICVLLLACAIKRVFIYTAAILHRLDARCITVIAVNVPSGCQPVESSAALHLSLGY